MIIELTADIFVNLDHIVTLDIEKTPSGSTVVYIGLSNRREIQKTFENREKAAKWIEEKFSLHIDTRTPLPRLLS